jgi:biopolymer transport protein TolQ
MNQSFHILFKSYTDSDPMGKLIFFLLLILSILCWAVIAWKGLLYFRIKRIGASNMSLIENPRDGILSLTLPPSAGFGVYQELFEKMKSKALKLLEKNQYFSSQEAHQVFLSKDDLELIGEDLHASIAKTMKQVDSGLFILYNLTSLSPFVGILGTVWGILICLFEMQKGSQTLSSSLIIQGLSTALGTTVIGLLIAIPALISYALLKNQSKGIALHLNLYAKEMLTHLELQYKKVN